MEATQIHIYCCSNPDYSGIWHKVDVLKEMQDVLEAGASYDDWLEWVLCHTIDDADLPASVLKTIKEPGVVEISYWSKNSGLIKIKLWLE